jgi:hypothetical protein
VLPGHSNRPNHRPWLSRNDYFYANKASGQLLRNAPPLIIIREAVFTKAVAQQPAEESLAGSMTATCILAKLCLVSAWIRRPDDIQATAKRNFA